MHPVAGRSTVARLLRTRNRMSMRYSGSPVNSMEERYEIHFRSSVVRGNCVSDRGDIDL